MRKLALILFIFLLILVSGRRLQARDTAGVLLHQGRLLDSDGAPLGGEGKFRCFENGEWKNCIGDSLREERHEEGAVEETTEETINEDL